jgi:predicted PurR-regulated permease PerM
MRTLIVLLAALAVLVPGLALGANPHANECRRMTRQINHYDDVLQLARGRQNELWENATKAQINRLANRRARLCPEMVQEARAKKEMREFLGLMKSAAQAARKYFTGGWW